MIDSEQLELQMSERPVRTTLFPPGSPGRPQAVADSDTLQGSVSSSSSPTKLVSATTSCETSYASALASQSVESSSADDFLSPDEEVVLL